MLYLGTDHGGFKLKEQLKGFLEDEGIEYEDLGNHKLDENDDYPVFSKKVAERVSENPDEDRGILLCRTGVGVTLVADKFDGVRAVLGFNDDQVRKARGDEGVNVLAVASDYTSFDDLKNRVKVFLETPFSGQERHQRRLGELGDIEKANFKKSDRHCACEDCKCR